MNTHKHARLTFLRRLEMVQQLIAHQVCVPEAARAYGVTAPTVRKWLGRFLAQGQAGLADASSRPTVSPRAIAPAKALAIVELRRKRLTQARIAQALGVSASTVSRVLARAGLSHLADLEPAEPVVRYEHQAPGDLLHIDIKKLGRIQRPGHRVTGNRRDTVEGAGWDFVFVAIDDHARVAFTDIHPDERFPSAVQFLKDAVAYYQRLGVTIQRLLTDNGSAFRSRAFAALCHELGIKHRFTRPYRPQTNGKAERFIQSALREWAYAHTYQNSPAAPPQAAGPARARLVVRDNDQHTNDIEQSYRVAIRAARRDIVIANAYFFPGYRLLRDLRAAAARGVRVRLILQGEPDMPIAQLGARLLYDALAEAGVEILEYCERPLHGKVASIDDEWATVGSSNLDPFSLALNLEANVEVRDSAFASGLRERLERLAIDHCRPAPQSDGAGRQLRRLFAGALVYHFLRRFPAWAGSLPAHKPRIQTLRPDGQGQPDEAT
ncbi:transposase, IS481 family [Bordetella pertussis 2371640]|nr:transposase, IS481 family [Bordetella pertussis 2371640]